MTAGVVAALVAGGAVALATRSADAAPGTGDHELVTLDGPLSTVPDGRGDRFFNYDANWKDGEEGTNKKADWPVNLVFVARSANRAVLSTSKVKDTLASFRIGLPTVNEGQGVSGSAMHMLLETGAGDDVWQPQWDSDQGWKLFPNTCRTTEGPDVNYHLRVYGPDGEGVLRYPDTDDGGHVFVVATSHIDYRESCDTGIHYSGESESAEQYFTHQFIAHHYRVERKKLHLGNEAIQGGLTSDGYASVIHLDEKTDDSPPADEPPVAEAGDDLTGAEGTEIDLRGGVWDDVGLPSVHWTATPGDDVDPGASCTFSSISGGGKVRCTDDGTYTLTLTADDGKHDPVSDTTTLHVGNSAPTLAKITSPEPWQVFRKGDKVTVRATVHDDGANDTLTCAITWDDGSETRTVAEDGACTAVNRYEHAGMFTIRVRLTDDDGGAGTEAEVMAIVVDPAGAWANVDGRYESQDGALTERWSAGGTARVTVASKYYPSSPDHPTGRVQSWLPGLDYDVRSTTLDWMVVTPDGKVAVKGTGTRVDHPGTYGFVVYTYSGCDAPEAVPGMCQPGGNRVRVVVWPLAAGDYPMAVDTYDNRRGADFDLDAANPVPMTEGNVLLQRPS